MKKTGYIYIALGAVFAASACASSLTSKTHSGVIVTYVLAAVFILAGTLSGRLAPRLPRWAPRAFAAAVAVGISVLSALVIYGSVDTATYDEDAVIVLGCGLRGEEVGVQLKCRLDAALRYHAENPDAVIVLSGGQGEDEAVPECRAMKKYLLSKGVPEDMMIEESASTNTRENCIYSKELLDGRLGAGWRAAIVTSDYHVARSELHAHAAGIAASHIHGASPLYLLIPNAVRECLGIIRQFVFGWL